MALQDLALTGPVTFTAQVRDEEGVTLVCLQGELDLSNVSVFCTRFWWLPNCLLLRRCESISLRWSFIDSTTIGFLVAACKKERSAGGIFSLRCSEGPVFRVLEVSGLIDFFKVEVVA